MHIDFASLKNAAKPRNLRRATLLGLKSLWMRKLRSLLTVLGIVFGVCSVIAMLAIGEGASYEAQEQIRQLGSRNVIIESVRPPESATGSATDSKTSFVAQYGLTYRDIAQIRDTIPGVEIVVPARTIRNYVWHLTRNIECEISGSVPWYPEMKNLEMLNGRFFGDLEMESRANVGVLNEGAARALFPLSDPLGKTVRIGGTYFRIVGVVKDTASADDTGGADEGGSATADAQQAAAFFFVPLNTLLERFGDVLFKRSAGSFSAEKIELHEVTVRIDDPEKVVASANAIRRILEKNHSELDYRVTVPIELLRQAERTKQIFNIVLGSIAAISLLVGGIGIMNIMLASVTERTREIGIRRALGAKRSDIVLQFLIETVLLSSAGGLMGVVLGLAIPITISYFAEMMTIIRLWAPTLAFTISVLTGIAFGIYPAMRASEMNPVEALRHE
ncbi:MAG: ABC transporter permease [Verrucomicrobiales bacterium]